jgi:hypothetical protein
LFNHPTALHPLQHIRQPREAVVDRLAEQPRSGSRPQARNDYINVGVGQRFF